jgi:flagellar motor component MotA
MKEQIAEAMGWADVWMTQQTFYWLTSTIAQVFAALVVFSFTIVVMIVGQIRDRQKRIEADIDILQADELGHIRDILYIPLLSFLLIKNKYGELGSRYENEINKLKTMYDRNGFATKSSYIDYEINNLNILIELGKMVNITNLEEDEPYHYKMSMHSIKERIGIFKINRYMPLEENLESLEILYAHNIKLGMISTRSMPSNEYHYQKTLSDYINMTKSLITKKEHEKITASMKDIEEAQRLTKEHEKNNERNSSIYSTLSWSLVSSVITIIISLGTLALYDILGSVIHCIAVGVVLSPVFALLTYFPLANQLIKSQKPTD